ncbi:hypothetical protein IW140_003515 [Coemansia sp. RSA 1813]|nr:hypothetical protein IW138_000359 [Coemansia sp. RSA 986]KAJ2214325.1 hypothetical protein EV179_003105 [Coemansia sp. RSA 487]KAJ2568891.1 hypothetical protein IW140_003515 [Coemansia sp. RSA 1813]
MAHTGTFSFFRKGAFSFDGIAFSGDHEKNPQKKNDILPTYCLHIGSKSIELLEQTPAGLQPAVTGEFESVFQSKALLHTKNSLSSAKTNSTFSRGWTFVYLSSEYKWKVSLMSTKWTLTDTNKQVIASFKRSNMKIMRLGTLNIHIPADPELTALIVITCHMVQYTNEACELAAVV